MFFGKLLGIFMKSVLLILLFVCSSKTQVKQSTIIKSDTVVENRVQKAIDQYEKAINDYATAEYRNDSLVRIIRTLKEQVYINSRSIESYVSDLIQHNRINVSDTVNNAKRIEEATNALKNYYSRLLNIESELQSAENKLITFTKYLENKKNDYQKAKTGINRSIPGSYSGGLRLRYHNNWYHVFLIDKHYFKTEIYGAKSNEGQTLSDCWERIRKDGHTPVMIMNAGMFNAAHDAEGLLIVNRKKISGLNLTNRNPNTNFYMFPNGVFHIDTSGCFSVEESISFQRKYNNEDYSGIKAATQSGPMLVVNNTIHKNFTLGSSNVNIRNGVGVTDQNTEKVSFVLSESKVNFFDLSIFFRDVLNCSNALYLDGVVSRMYYDYLGQSSGRIDMSQHLGPLITVYKD